MPRRSPRSSCPASRKATKGPRKLPMPRAVHSMAIPAPPPRANTRSPRTASSTSTPPEGEPEAGLRDQERPHARVPRDVPGALAEVGEPQQIDPADRIGRLRLDGALQRSRVDPFGPTRWQAAQEQRGGEERGRV